MISNVSFAGRETMLTGGIKSATELAKEAASSYINVGRNFTKAEISEARKLATEAKIFKDPSDFETRVQSYIDSHQPVQAPAPKPAETAQTVNYKHIDFFA